MDELKALLTKASKQWLEDREKQFEAQHPWLVYFLPVIENALIGEESALLDYLAAKLAEAGATLPAK